MAARNPLGVYQRMRDFSRTPEPAGPVGSRSERLAFVIQKHAARSLHYDFRLELDGTLKSWAVPKGPSLDPHDKRMAVQVEDHPLSYADFEGVIPPHQYGAGSVIVWDRGTWVPVGDARRGLRDGKLKFALEGVKLRGLWALVRMRPRRESDKPTWLLIKEHDEFERPAADYQVVEALPDSVRQRHPAPAPKPAAAKRALPGTRAALPAKLAPQLATLVDGIPPGDDWLYEIKFDGYRLLTRIGGREVRCITRNGHDWSAKLPPLVDACRALGLRNAWLDGEIGVAGENGAPDFQALQNAFDSAQTERIVYYLFDLPFLDGRDLRALPLVERRQRLQALLQGHADGPLRFSENFDADPKALLESAQRNGLEGLIGKRRNGLYVSRRSADWVKLKTQQRQEFVIGGYTDPQGSRHGLGSLLLGLHDAQGRLHYAGNVGAGFDEATLRELTPRLAKLAQKSSPFVDAPARVGTVKKAVPHWVRPALLAEVSFSQWTRDKKVRHSVFQGLRLDKAARGIQPEVAHKAAAPARRAAAISITTAAAASVAAGPRVTHADRVIDRSTGTRKGDLVAYYERIAPLMLPHLQGRPVALLRAPGGLGRPMFFQKHAGGSELPHVELLDPALDPEHEPLLAVNRAEALVGAAQMNVIELHTWNATARAIAKPDRMIFDLDPGEGVDWSQVKEGTQLVHDFLGELGLQSFLKSSGGKGLHVVVPLQPRRGWDVVKDFSEAIVAHMAQVVPQLFVAKSGPRNRVGRIFIDYLRNGFGATTVAAWSVRARAGLGISVPLAWDELAALKSAAQWSVGEAGDRVAIGNLPWQGYEAARQVLGPAMKALRFKPLGGT